MTVNVMGAHPATELFPMLSDDELRKLADDIKARGLRTPIVTVEEGGERKILDGRNRFRACVMAGVEPVFIPFGGEDPFALVVSANLLRRYMNESQRAMVADALAKLRDGVRKSGAQICAGDGPSSQSDAAKLLNVSRRQVQKARRVKEHGVPELVTAVVAGEIALNAADQVVKLPAEEQRRLVTGKNARNGVSKCIEHPASADKSPSSRRGHPSKRFDAHEKVQELSAQGFGPKEIAQQTGLKIGFVNHARHQIVKAKPKSVLAGSIQDAEVFAESWLSRATAFDPRWARAPENEKTQLIEALRACCTAAKKVIQRLNKEANGVTAS